MAAAEAPPPPVEPDVGEAEVSVDDTAWIVRVVGRSGAAGHSSTPLLLLGFWRADAAEGDREREALVVGRALRDLTQPALRRAFSRSTPPPDPPAGDDGGREGDRRGRRSRGPRRGR